MWKSLKNLFAGSASEADASVPQTQAEQASAPPDLSSHYTELGLEDGADMSAIRRAWKEGLKQVHMDHYSDDPDTRRHAQDKARRINEAYRALQDALT